MKRLSLFSLTAAAVLVLAASGCCCKKQACVKTQPCYTTTVSNELDNCQTTYTAPALAERVAYEPATVQEAAVVNEFESVDDFEDSFNK